MSRFKISTVLENRSFLTTIPGNVNILSPLYPSLSLSGPTGPTGPAGGGGGGGEIITITDNLGSVSLLVSTTIINNFTQTGLTVSLGVPTDNTVKTIDLSAGSFPTNITTGFGTFILEGGDTVTLVFIDSRWNILSNEGVVVPITQQGSRISTFRPANSVSISADGSTVAAGLITDGGNIGATYIFVRNSNGLYTQQGPKLVGSGNVGGSNQGSSVSLSSDGNTLAVGGRGDNTNIGATWIFTRSAGVWTQQGSKLVGSGGVGNSNQGQSTSLSSDGNTLAIGGFIDNGLIGATWIFTRSAGVWTQQGNKLVGSGNIGSSQQGVSVSLSDDGNILAIGGNADNASIGAVWIFTRSAGVWTQQGNKLVGTGNVGASRQGHSVSLSSDGTVLAIGGRKDNLDVGATWIFTGIGGVFTQQGNKIVGTGTVGPLANQGASVSLSSDGNTLAVGGDNDNNGLGSVWIFTLNTGVRTQIAKLGSNANGGVSISNDGSILATTEVAIFA